ncbi:sulfurtransferase complex subunit TusB [Pseudohalioglobus sediminis]|uniref:Sulfurtransferase complex subunit TusB n=1 Tax=Pseudohalioglobus sediminis TaxID=2606449 RepID=A0A5B0WN03_9GAMM|nr:sulfurtransferase complex subunit TusB [Pseudohalioglobus sediminis]KAA1188206.1 sulfurtransferase complex subunit TusB [Pseudohalioglobus sediminis]
MILHTLTAMAPAQAFSDCLRCAGQQDTIVLMGDGVYNAVAGSAPVRILAQCAARVVVLDVDAAAAGLNGKLDDLALVDMDGLVALSEAYPRQLAWY